MGKNIKITRQPLISRRPIGKIKRRVSIAVFISSVPRIRRDFSASFGEFGELDAKNLQKNTSQGAALSPLWGKGVTCGSQPRVGSARRAGTLQKRHANQCIRPYQCSESPTASPQQRSRSGCIIVCQVSSGVRLRPAGPTFC